MINQISVGSTLMKAIEFHAYGPPEVIQVREVPRPVPKDNEVLIKVHASTVTSGDVRIRSATFPAGFSLIARLMLGPFKPRATRLGNEFAGEIESVGKDVTRFQKGDQVFGGTGMELGSNAEYICLPEDGAVALKPENMTFEEAAAIPFGGLTSLIFLRDMGKIEPGQKVLIYGASGSLGVYGVQLAKYFGAKVTGVCSTANIEMVTALGADRVIDYTREDYTQMGETYDIIYDTIGKTSFSKAKSVLVPKGVFLAASGGIPDYLLMLWTSLFGNKKVVGGLAVQKQEDMIFLKSLIEIGKMTSVIDKRYPLAQIAEAHGYVEKGHKKGNVVITHGH